LPLPGNMIGNDLRGKLGRVTGAAGFSKPLYTLIGALM
jgi:hypothetical protein